MAITNAQMVAQETFELIRAGRISPNEEIHTFQRWKALGYSVKKGEHAVSKIPIWKMATRKNKDGEEEETGRMFIKTSAFFSTAQVEPIPARA